MEKIKISDYLNSPIAIGSDLGKVVYKQLIQAIKLNQNQQIIHICMSGVDVADATFIRDSILTLAKLHRGKKGYVISGFETQKISSNWSYAARALEQPIVTLADGQYTWIDASLIKNKSKEILAFAHKKKIISSSDVAGAFDMTLQAASLALKKLFELGFLLRDLSTSPNNKYEYKYQVIELKLIN